MVTRKQLYNLLPPPQYRSKLIAGWQNTDNIIDAIKYQHLHNLPDAKIICKYFKGSDAKSTAQNIFNFLKTEIQYDIEPSSRQTTKTLSRFLADGKGDCKHFSLFANTILQCCGYKPLYRFAGYNGKEIQHVYTCLPKENIILDAVLPTFNKQKDYTTKKDINMSLYRLSGIDDADDISGINFSKVKENIKTASAKASNVVKAAAKEIPAAAKKIEQGMKTAGLAIPRNAFLELVNLNFNGLAADFKKVIDEKGDEGIKWWVELGGDRSAFTKAIENGSTKKQIFGIQEETDSAKEIFTGYDADGVDVNGIGVVATAAAASAAPILIKAADVLKKLKPASDAAKKAADVAKTAATSFKKATGKSVTDVIFKKESGLSSNKTELTSSDLAPVSNETATKVATAAVAQGAGLTSDQIKSTTKPTNFMQWIKDNKFIVGGGILAIGALVFIAKKKGKKTAAA
jgi:hypothetical protein